MPFDNTLNKVHDYVAGSESLVERLRFHLSRVVFSESDKMGLQGWVVS